MAILYITDQGATVHKSGETIIIQKCGEIIQKVHAFKIEQIVLFGNIQLSSNLISFLLEQGIDTVFLSSRGEFKGRLVAKFGKNILLRQLQFKKLDNEEFCKNLARQYIIGKLANARHLLRKYNYELKNTHITECIHSLRNLIEKLQKCENLDSIRGLEGKGASIYFSCFKYLIKDNELKFDTRNKRPPKDPVNALLSFGYTLLANSIQTVVNIVGLDPYLGSFHTIDYGRPSLILDLMEEFRPIIIDSLVIKLINKRIITLQDFYFQEEVSISEDKELDNPSKEDYPVLLSYQGIKKILLHYEKLLNEETYYKPKEQKLNYKNIFLEQARLLVRHLKGEEEYVAYQP